MARELGNAWGALRQDCREGASPPQQVDHSSRSAAVGWRRIARRDGT